MLKSNLSNRPFYNERLVSLVIVLVAAIAVALTAFNVTELRSLSSRRAAFNKDIDADAAEFLTLDAKARALTSTVNAGDMKQLAIGAREANDLIDKRTFSWTAFLSVIEKTLPIGARLVEVQPKPEKNVMHVGMVVVCQTPEDLYTLLEALQNTAVFTDVVPSAQSPNDDGTETAAIQTVYLGQASAPAPAAAPPTKKSGKGRS